MVIFFFKHDAIDIADPSSMQEASERGTGGLRFDPSWELRIFFYTIYPTLMTR